MAGPLSKRSPGFGRRSRGGAPRGRAAEGAAEVEVVITAIGARGDGVAMWAGERVFVPLTVPGDRVRVCLEPRQADGRRGRVTAWLERGHEVIEPACSHFGVCGGCTLQHVSAGAYIAWKREQVAAALIRAGFSTEPSLEVRPTSPGSRRRATFTVMRHRGVLLAGFTRRLSHRLIDLEGCPVLAPELVALLPQLRVALACVLPEGGHAEVAVTRLDDGLDVVLTGPPSLTLGNREALAAFAETADVGRLSWQPESRAPIEPVAARRPMRVRFGGTAVMVPPGTFLQASAEGEAALVAAVVAGVGEAATVADLYAGCGTFSLPLAVGVRGGGRRVYAVDGNGPALAALARAARGVPGILAECRDLGREPLTVAELARFDAVVFDPPRAGAAAQASALAASAVPVVVAVSCNPATFARDARLLAEGGFRLASVVAVDQFLWSAHVELVAVFRR